MCSRIRRPTIVTTIREQWVARVPLRLPHLIRITLRIMTTNPTETTTAWALRPPRIRPFQRSVGRSTAAPRSTPTRSGEEDGGPNVRQAHRAGSSRRVRLDRPDRSARPLPLVGPVHPAQARDRRRPDRHARAARARGRVLHAPRAHRRRPAHHRAAARHRGISTDFARDTADLTDRQNIQLHWIRVEDIPEIWRRLEAVGLSTTEACGDVPRVILGSPGRRHRRRRDHRPHPADRRDHRASSATRRWPTCRASSRPPSPATPARTWSTRSTTSPSSRSSTPSWASATTCGSAAGSPPTPTRRAPRRLRHARARPPTSGTASPRSSATTATGACAPRPA